MTDAEIINTIATSLKTNALGDIKKASLGGSKMGAFILCSCLIDAMAGFEEGRDTTNADYKSFVTRRLPSYSAEGLYKDLRCKLVHSYSEGGSYVFVDNKPELHFVATTTGLTVINLENFVADIESALNDHIAEISIVASTRRQKAITRFNGNGVVRVQAVHVETATGYTTTDSASAR
jgi:hypothetical protein